MKNILMILYKFPPAGGSGTFRNLKFAKYLPEFSWNPIILSVKESNYEKKDFSLVSEISDKVEIHRVGQINLLNTMRITSRQGDPVEGKAGNITRSCFSNIVKKLSGKSSLVRLVRRAILNLLSFPDQYAGWFLPSLFKGFVLIHRKNIRVIYSSSPPVTAHLISFVLKLLTGRKLVIDFRDPWIETLHINGAYRKISILLEKLCIMFADTVILNTQAMYDVFIAKYLKYNSKFIVIHNGYDEKDFVNIGWLNSAPNDRCIITHSGEFYDKLRTPISFLKAISELIREEKIMPKKIQIIFIGGGEYVRSAEFTSAIKDLKLERIVNSMDYVNHEDCLRILFGSSALLLFQNDPFLRMQIPAKTFEYLRIGRPIISLAPSGAVTRLLSDFAHVVNCEPLNTPQIKEGILTVLNNLKSFETSNIQHKIMKFERRELTKLLADCLNEVVKETF